MKLLSSPILAIMLLIGALAASGKAYAQPAAALTIPCQYPRGWSSTDASRDVNGTPPGYDHECIVEFHPPDLIVAPCLYREVFSSINWSRIIYDRPVRVEYRCSPR